MTEFEERRRTHDHNEILERLIAIENNQRTMADILKPMNESYQLAIRFGKWVSGVLVFISIAIGIILSLKDLFAKK